MKNYVVIHLINVNKEEQNCQCSGNVVEITSEICTVNKTEWKWNVAVL